MEIRLSDIALADFQNALVTLIRSRKATIREVVIDSTFELLDKCLSSLIAEGRLVVVKADETHLDVFKPT